MKHRPMAAALTLKHYPASGHAGITADTGDPLAAYRRPGKVDAGLIDDVVAWITNQGSRP